MKGVLMSLSIVTFGMVLMMFAVTHNHLSKTTQLESNMMAVDRVNNMNTNVADNIEKIYKTKSGLNISQTKDTITVKESIPNDFSKYGAELVRMGKFMDENTPDTSFTTPSNPRIYTPHGVNITHTTDRRIELRIPPQYGVEEITLAGATKTNITDCNYTYTPGEEHIRVSVRGAEDHECTTTKQVNTSARVFFGVNNGGLTLDYEDGILGFENNLPTQVEYELSVKLNDTTYLIPATIEGAITTQTQSAKKTSQITVKW